MKAPLADLAPREQFVAEHPYPLDRFQLDALDLLDDGQSVLVSAPTGSGKTVVAEYAVHLALREGAKIFYTTPIKALSNQKYGDLRRKYGADRVGLLTGDNSINGQGPIVVMTTEVLRNMIHSEPGRLADLRYVVLDEVHFLQDPYRGGVWEEVILGAPANVTLVCLSATVANADQLAAWISRCAAPRASSSRLTAPSSSRTCSSSGTARPSTCTCCRPSSRAGPIRSR